MPEATPAQIQAAHKEQTKIVLGMLQCGPQTTGQFIRAGIARFSARLMELRAVGWEISTQKLDAHEAVYTLHTRDLGRGRCGTDGCGVCA